jgi:hypothetical protein
LVGALHESVVLARFQGKGVGYAAVNDIPASALLFQERPFKVCGSFQNAEDARRALARAAAKDARFARLGAGIPKPSPAKETDEPSPFTREGIDDRLWNETLDRVRRHASVRRVKRNQLENAGDDPSATGFSFGTVSESADEAPPPPVGSVSVSDAPPIDSVVAGETTGYVARFFAHARACTHSCRPNAAASASESMTTVYSLRAIEAGEEITVSYATALLWLPLHARRAALARAWGFLCACDRCELELSHARAERDRGVGVGATSAARHGSKPEGGFESRVSRERDRDAGFRAWEYGETGFENQFDDEGRLLGISARSSGGDDRDAGGANPSRADAASRADGGDKGVDANETRPSSSDSDSTSSLSDSSESDSESESEAGRLTGSHASQKWRGPRRGGAKAKGSGAKATTRIMRPSQLYEKLVSSGIGPDHWQMHSVREALISESLSSEGRKEFDLDVLLEHANCASRLAPNHPHFIRLMALVEEVFKRNEQVIAGEQFWVWTIELLREAVHPDVLFWNTEFKAIGSADRDTRGGVGGSERR